MKKSLKVMCLKKIVLIFLLTIFFVPFLYSQNKEAFEIFYLPTKEVTLADHYTGEDITFSTHAGSMIFFNDKLYIGTVGGVYICFDLLTKSTYLINRWIDSNGIEQKFTSFINISLKDIPYCNGVGFTTPEESFDAVYTTGGVPSPYPFPDKIRYYILDSVAKYPRAIYDSSYSHNLKMFMNNEDNKGWNHYTRSTLKAFPPLQFESEFSPEDAKIFTYTKITCSASVDKPTRRFVNFVDKDHLFSFDTSGIIEYPKYYLNDAKFTSTFPNDSTILLFGGGGWNICYTVLKCNFKSKEIYAIFEEEQSSDSTGMYCFAPLVYDGNTFADRKVFITKKWTNDINIPMELLLYDNVSGEVVKVAEIDHKQSPIYDRYRDTIYPKLNGYGDTISWEPLTDAINIYSYFMWSEKEILFNYKASIGGRTGLHKSSEFRRIFAIYNYETNKFREFIIPAELFTVDDFNDTLLNHPFIEAQFDSHCNLPDGRRAFILSPGLNNLNASVLIIYDPKLDTNSIEDRDAPSILSSKIYPNPAIDGSRTLSIKVSEASHIKIVLNDLLGDELQVIHNAFTDAGTFTKTFSTLGLSRGVYYLKMQIGTTIKIEKVVVN